MLEKKIFHIPLLGKKYKALFLLSNNLQQSSEKLRSKQDEQIFIHKTFYFFSAFFAAAALAFSMRAALETLAAAFWLPFMTYFKLVRTGPYI